MDSTHRTDWFHHARWGIATHFLGSPEMTAEAWQARVEAFDVAGLVAQLAATGAGYYLFTIGQNSGHYCAPNAAYDRLTGIQPSKCARRDLIAEIADALHPHNIALLAYLPSGAPTIDPVACERLQWEWGFESAWPMGNMPRTGKRLAEFQQKWEAVIREWSLRWGARVRGWWFDGCYFSEEMYEFPDPPNYASFAAAARAGNPDSIVAFNPGVMLKPVTPVEDYTAGETNEPDTIACPGRWIDNEQFHIFSYLGENWGQAPPRFTDVEAAVFTRRITEKGGVVTWDVPIEPTGLLPQPFVDHLCAMGQAMQSGQSG